MDKVSLEGKDYVKAASVARELGYTRDYIGQLCRAKKIDAQLVGRSWYVYLPSLHEHKKNRYQGVSNVVKKEVAPASVPIDVKPGPSEASQGDRVLKPNTPDSQVRVQINESVANTQKELKTKKGVNYEKHLDKYRPGTYTVDDAELFPAIKTVHVTGLQQEDDIKADDAVEITVTESDVDAAEYYLEKKHEAPLRGQISVADADAPVAPSVPTNVAKSVSQTQSRSTKKTPTKKVVKKVHKGHVVSGNRRKPTLDPVLKTPVGPMSEELFPQLKKDVVRKSTAVSGAEKQKETVWSGVQAAVVSPITLSVVAGLIFSSLAIGLSWKLDFTNADVMDGYEFNVSNAIGAQ